MPIPTDPIGHSAAANPQSTPVSNVETSPRPVASNKDERTTNESTKVPAAVTPPPTKPPTTTKPTTTKPITMPAPHTTPLPPPNLG
ncbi:PREDICTED: gamete and mating-type specific protein A-like [Vollenhovia emeryi]|uniref:gamete and mating-type specific protein A-like n=1 Tax=Vollenhovia emeryi TaxID=411798 RepID=UPI0005F4348E|nr:PREDICTED: gamete and mating-type specific protein A-like [Vollenhovia emeryi]